MSLRGGTETLTVPSPSPPKRHCHCLITKATCAFSIYLVLVSHPFLALENYRQSRGHADWQPLYREQQEQQEETRPIALQIRRDRRALFGHCGIARIRFVGRRFAHIQSPNYPRSLTDGFQLRIRTNYLAARTHVDHIRGNMYFDYNRPTANDYCVFRIGIICRLITGA